MDVKPYLIKTSFILSLAIFSIVLFHNYGKSADIEISKRMEEHIRVAELSNEVDSFAKRAEGHLFLYLFAGDETDREKFFQRVDSLNKQLKLLSETPLTPAMKTILDDIVTESDKVLKLGISILNTYPPYTASIRLPGFKEDIKQLHSYSSTIRNQGVALLQLSAMALDNDKLAIEAQFKDRSNISIGIIIISAILMLVIVHQSGRISQSVRLAHSMEKLSYVDALTNIGNRRKFDEELTKEWNSSLHSQHKIGLILIDVDFFKAFNDLYGHTEGDICLKKIANILQPSLKRNLDIVARYGGEEFAIILPDTDDVLPIAERIRSSVEDAGIPHESSAISDVVTISIGYGSFAADRKSSPEQMLKRVDKALYKAKHSGRNTIIAMDS